VSGAYPSVPHDRLTDASWKLQSRSDATVFQVAAVTVRAHTLVYGDSRLRRAVESAGLERAASDTAADADRLVETGSADLWRFFFATALSFRPPLPAGIGPASLRSTVTRRARRSFRADLEARGFEGIEEGGSQRIRTDSGDRARLRKLTATLPLEADHPDGLETEGWLAVWVTDGSFRLAGGAYPVDGLTAALDSPPASERERVRPEQFRDELLELIRAVR
jgi:hypothetical protein